MLLTNHENISENRGRKTIQQTILDKCSIYLKKFFQNITTRKYRNLTLTTLFCCFKIFSYILSKSILGLFMLKNFQVHHFSKMTTECKMNKKNLFIISKYNSLIKESKNRLIEHETFRKKFSPYQS